MLITLDYPSPEAERRLVQIARRRTGADPNVEQQVAKILQSVREDGDRAVLDYCRRYDAPGMDLAALNVTPAEIDLARDRVDSSFVEILRRAIDNIESFHRRQLRSSWFDAKEDGTIFGQIVQPVASAGLYIPGGAGGRTPLISSVLMNAIPARIAGVRDIALVSPPRRDGTLDSHLLAAAAEVGVTRIHKMGSAWAIAALAYGTETVEPVDVIVGPGNVYVTTAKRIVSGEVGIDLLAGPSEILVIADEGADPGCVAADLLGQAEHDSMASAVLVTCGRSLAEAVAVDLEARLRRLPRREIAERSIVDFGAAFVVADLAAAVALANRMAPEHLELQVADPWPWVGRIRHAGALFLGYHSPEAVGDYFAGPNHVLPTAGTARFASALGVDHFVKKTSVIAYSRPALERDAGAIVSLARLEGLEAHAQSVRARVGGKAGS